MTIGNIALPAAVRDESDCVDGLLRQLGALDWEQAMAPARRWVDAVRARPAPFWALESLLRDYPISSREGLALMRLAEALLRVPDSATAALLAADQLGGADFTPSAADHTLQALGARLIALSRQLLPDEAAASRGLLARWGAAGVVAAAVRAIALLGQQFVLGQTLEQARRRAAAQRRQHPGLLFSYDMLGEGARCADDAERYHRDYRAALDALAPQPGDGPQQRDGVSIKLSALHPRVEEAQRAQVFSELLPRLVQLAEQAAAADVNLTLDAEESERLALQLDLFDALAAALSRHASASRWRGLGLAVQAYQTRAPAVLDALADIARSRGLGFTVRLVKGAYWDAEIKRAQEMGLDGYPVFTRKHHTDISYLACARQLLQAADRADARLYPQFASHNAATLAAVLHLAGSHPRAAFELQRLHGMGEAVYRELLQQPGLRCRVYAPVGQHRDLLAYLVRRLLENGANTAFVHQLADPQVTVEQLLDNPLWPDPQPALPAPRQLYGLLHGRARANPLGFDPAEAQPREAQLAATRACRPPTIATVDAAAADRAMQRLHAAWPGWEATPLQQRCDMLLRAADRLEAQRQDLVALLMVEAHKTLGDALAEWREAVDHCRYHALQGLGQLQPVDLPGPTGESNQLRLRGRGVFVCISPWNFPLAIFAAQVTAALVAGNCVAAKPAEQTPACARALVDALIEAGVPRQVLALLPGPGDVVGAALVADPHCAGVAFTGSTAVARGIARALSARSGPLCPLIAETAGVNAMIVDSSALPEQVIDAVIASAFRSAGQRCSSLRLLCVQDDIADALLAMLGGAMQQLRLGAATDFDTDVGPVIDAEAWQRLADGAARLQRDARLLARTRWPPRMAALAAPGSADTLALRLPEAALSPWAPDSTRWLHWIAPALFAIDRVDQVGDELFGPLLQVVRWSGGELDRLVDAINDLGYGLTLGVHTRIDGRAHRIAARARCGNVYVNRNIIGAVVGVQPFGGQGLSGTGPKSGGPHYLSRFCAEQTLTINTAAVGGNAALLARGAA